MIDRKFRDVHSGHGYLKIENNELIAGIKSSRLVSIFAEYWMVNAVGRPLSYFCGSSIVHHPAQELESSSLLEEKSSDGEEVLEENKGMQEYNYLCFCRDPRESRQTKCILQTRDSELSEPFCLDNVGQFGSIELKEHHISGNIQESKESKDNKPLRRFDIGLHIKLATGRFNRTKIITFTPKYVIVNQLPYDILIGQNGEDSKLATRLESGKRIGWVWSNCLVKHPRLTFRHEANNSQWSGGFEVNSIGDFYVQVSYTNNDVAEIVTDIVHVDITQVDAIGVVMLSQTPHNMAPYLLVNRCAKQTIRYTQENVNMWLDLRPGEQKPFCWYEPYEQHRLVISTEEAEIRAQQKNRSDRITDVAKITAAGVGTLVSAPATLVLAAAYMGHQVLTQNSAPKYKQSYVIDRLGPQSRLKALNGSEVHVAVIPQNTIRMIILSDFPIKGLVSVRTRVKKNYCFFLLSLLFS